MANPKIREENRKYYATYGFKEMSDPPAGMLYDTHTWLARESEYLEALSSIELPFEIGPHDLMALNAMIDQVRTIAINELTRIDQAYELFRTKRRSFEQVYFNQMKQDMLAQDPNKRYTEAEVNSAVQTAMNTMPFEPHLYGGAPLYALYIQAYNCKSFLDLVFKSLSEKKEALITNSAAMKILANAPDNRIPENYQPQPFVPPVMGQE